MCGPILLALPSGSNTDIKFIAGRIFYNLGRVITYSLFGLFFGFIGKGFAIFGFQRWVSISIGIIVLIYIFLPLKFKKVFLNIHFFSYITGKLKLLFGKLFQKKSLSAMLLIGIINGLLPCGFVYMGIAGSLAMGDAFRGMLFMTLFGLGTIPAMLTSSFIFNYISLSTRQKIIRLLPVFAIILALIFILRGLNLGIPYISPKLDMHKTEMKKDCCT